jgi:hypothetical protein
VIQYLVLESWGRESRVGQIEAISQRRTVVGMSSIACQGVHQPTASTDAFSLITATAFSWFRTTYRVLPRTSKPSPLVSEAPPNSTCVATPVRDQRRYSKPVSS